MKRSPKIMANWLAASFHVRGGMLQSLVILHSARNSNSVAASSQGKLPRFLTIFLGRMCKLSFALVV